MKKIKFVKILLVLVVMLGSFFGITGVNAATSLPGSFVSDNHKVIEYIDNFRVVVKTADNGKYYIYCMNMEKTYAGDIKFNMKGTVDDGFVYILNNVPNTGDKDKDFYITQMAVWYYEDYLNQNNANLDIEVNIEKLKKYLRESINYMKVLETIKLKLVN